MPKCTVTLPKCTWHHGAGTRLVGSDSELRKADANPRHCWEGAAGVQGMGCQHPSARPRSLGQLRCRYTFLQVPVSGAKMGTGISVEILAFTSPRLWHNSLGTPISRTRSSSCGLAARGSALRVLGSSVNSEQLLGYSNALLALRHGDTATCVMSPICSLTHAPFSWLMVALSPGPGGLFLTVCHVLPEHN